VRAPNRFALALSASAFLAGAALADDPAIPEVSYPEVPRQAPAAEGFVPAGWRIEQQVSGDLDGDGIADLVLVLRDADAKNILSNEDGLGESPFDSNPRILAVAFGGKPGARYTLALQNRTLIPRRVAPTIDDPLAEGGVSVERGNLRVKLGFFASAGSWRMSSTSYTFCYRDGRFELIGYDDDSTERNSGKTEGISLNYLTGRAKHTTGTIDSDSVKVSWETLPRRPLMTLEAVGDGLEFDPER